MINSTVVQTVTASSNLLNIQGLGLFPNDANEGYASFTTTAPFKRVRIRIGGVAQLLTQWNVYDGACVTLQ